MLKQRGIRTIAGRVVGDDNRFEDETLGFGWSWDDLPDDYAAGVGALQFNENAVRVTVAPGPAAGDYRGCQRRARRQRLERHRQRRHGRVRRRRVDQHAPAAGQHDAGAARLDPARRQPVDAGGVAVDNPTLFFVGALRNALIANGIDVRGEAADIDDVRPVRSDRGRTAGDLSVAAAVGARRAADEGEPEPVRRDVPEDRV